MKTQKDKLLNLVLRNPGLTATMYTRLLGYQAGHHISIDGKYNTYYKPASILRELHRMSTANGPLYSLKEHGMLYGKAWRFYVRD